MGSVGAERSKYGTISHDYGLTAQTFKTVREFLYDLRTVTVRAASLGERNSGSPSFLEERC